jgi:hypothetical protein
MQHQRGHYLLVAQALGGSVKKMELTADSIHGNVLDGFRVGIVRQGDIISIGKLDDSHDIESDAVERPMTRWQPGEVVAGVAVVRRGGCNFGLVKVIQVDRMLSRTLEMPVEHRRNKNHRDPRCDQQSHQPKPFHQSIGSQAGIVVQPKFALFMTLHPSRQRLRFATTI